MDISVEPGVYVIAVSGGVDSVALLHALAQRPKLDLVVAHFDHGIRSDSAQDVIFVQQLAHQYGLAFETERLELGPTASEARARETRYNFLQNIQVKHKASAIITAHHQDDLLETALLNTLRGTGRRGLTSLKSNETIKRPLLQVSKEDITAYALKHKLSWREDTTNYDERYTRNYLRHRLLVKLDDRTRQQLLATLGELGDLNQELDAQLSGSLREHGSGTELDARWFKNLPHVVACEVLASWLRDNRLADFDRPTIERLVVQAKTKPVGKRLNVRRNVDIVLRKQALALQTAER